MHPNPGSISMALVEELDVFPTCLEIAGLPLPPQKLHGASLMPLIQEPSRTAFKQNASFSQYPRAVGKQQYMGMTIRVAEWRFTEWCAFNYTAAYPIWSANDAFMCQLELYSHKGDDGKNMDLFENENEAYKLENRGTVEALHARLVVGWDNGLGPPPALPPSPPQPQPPSPTPVAPPGPPVRLQRDGKCLASISMVAVIGTAAGGADHHHGVSSSCSNPQCSGLAMIADCTGNATIWRELHDGAEPTQIEAAGGMADGDGGCLNLYGGGKAGSCPVGTGVHRTSCGRRFGNQFVWSGSASGQLKFGGQAGDPDVILDASPLSMSLSSTQQKGQQPPCGGLCLSTVGDCLVVGECAGAATKGWKRVPVGA